MSQESILGPYLKPGTPIKVGSYSTKIIRYLSEGGFSHVYTAKLDIPVKGSDVAVLKRIVAPDKAALAAIRTEVETMKKLKGHRYIVTYIDSHASALQHGGFEVYVLMEYCPGGGLIDFMNTRLQTRLAEWEVLKIISDTTEAVACMHYLRPPLLHRDLKIENVLISDNGDYKLCDFGSCTEPRSAATNSTERRDLEEDIQKNTTIQYRSPEMVDVGRRLPIDEKSDIWALGVLLYKLCYFTTPFETQGPLAILNAAYTFPPYPPYTDRTKRLIAVTLQENPRERPNIYQLLAEICAMRNVPVPVPDIYSKSRSNSQASRSRANSRPPSTANDDILTYEAAAAAASAAPKTPLSDAINREPMRRGRPERPNSPPKTDISSLKQVLSQHEVEHESSGRPSASNARSVIDEDEFATKFPSLEEMDLTLEASIARKSSNRQNGSKAAQADLDDQSGMTMKSEILQQARPVSGTRPSSSEQAQRREQGTDTVFESVVRPSAIAKDGNYIRRPQSRFEPSHEMSESKSQLLDFNIPSNHNQLNQPLQGSIPKTVGRPLPILPAHEKMNETHSKSSSNPYDRTPGMSDHLRSRPQMVSRSSQTSPKPKQGVQTQTSPAKSSLPSSVALSQASLSSNLMRDSSGFIVSRPSQNRSSKQELDASNKPQFKYTTSLDRPSDSDLAREQISRSKPSLGSRPQTIHVDSSLDYLRELDSPTTNTTEDSIEINRTGNSLDSDIGTRGTTRAHLDPNDVRLGASNIRRTASVSVSNGRHDKRPSLTHIASFSGAAKIMNGKFGEAFKKFESSNRSRGTTPASERSNPLQVAENDLPEHITQHLQSTEARRSSSYSRNRPSLDLLRQDQPPPILEKSTSVESTSSSVKDAMRRLKEKANQTYVPQRSAQGYGKYTEPETLQRAATVVPYTRVAGDEKPPISPKPIVGLGKNVRRYGLQEDDDESANFSHRYPSLSDFKV